MGQVQRNRKGLGCRRHAFRLADCEAVPVVLLLLNLAGMGMGGYPRLDGRRSARRSCGESGLGLFQHADARWRVGRGK